MSGTARRIVAFLIDLAIASAVAIVFVMMLDIASLLSKAVRKIDSLLSGRIGFLPPEALIRFVLILFLLTFKDFIFLSGSSFGKHLLKIKVIRQDGSRLTLLDSIKRTLPYAILPVEAYFVLTEQERLGDRWAGTAVVPIDYEPEEADDDDGGEDE